MVKGFTLLDESSGVRFDLHHRHLLRPYRAFCICDLLHRALPYVLCFRPFRALLHNDQRSDSLPLKRPPLFH